MRWMAKTKVGRVLVSAGIAAVLVLASSKARAQLCNSPPADSYCTPGAMYLGSDGFYHYYAIMQTGSAVNANYGASIDLFTNNLTITASQCKDAVQHEMWYCTSGVSSCSTWIEVGLQTGQSANGLCLDACPFWADMRPNNGGFHEHEECPGQYQNPPASFNTWSTAEVESANSSCTWNVYYGGVNIGQSTSNCVGSGRLLQAGIETIGPSSAQASGFMENWHQEDNSNVWRSWSVDGTCFYNNCPAAIQFMPGNSAETEEKLPGPFYLPVAFQANTHDLWIENYHSSGDLDEGLGMMAGTVPSLVVPPGQTDLAIVFQANTGHLWLDVTDARGVIIIDGDLGAAMKAGTSPSMAVTSGGNLVIAYQGSNGDLWLNENGSGSDQFLGMAPGTSPSVGVLPNGQVVTAFQANTGSLWIQQNGSNFNLGLGVMAGTSPSIAVNPSGGYAVAFQAAGTGHLWIITVASSPSAGFTYADKGLGMMAGTSPSVTFLANGTIEWAFQANTGNLYINFADQNLPMAHTASPSILPLPLGGYQVAYEASNSDLWLDVNGTGVDTYLGMNTP